MYPHDPYTRWCQERDVHHAHCPLGHEHPQPFVRDGVLVCGRCWFVDGVVTACEPCTPDVCGD